MYVEAELPNEGAWLSDERNRQLRGRVSDI